MGTQGVNNIASRTQQLPIALTMGEPGGISSEITVKAWQHFNTQDNVVSFFIIDDPKRYNCFDIPIVTIANPFEAHAAFQHGLPILDIGMDIPNEFGSAKTDTAKAVLTSIEQGVSYCKDGTCSALVTNPIQKNTLINHGFTFPGHTEYLANLTKDIPYTNPTRGPVMMLAGPALRTIPVTVHQALSEAISSLTQDAIIRTVLTAHECLQNDFNIKTPRIAISGLNPHAGEAGLFGTEEKLIIEPAIEKLSSKGVVVSGPLPADTMFYEEARNKYDVAICMYHDQALIPVKTLEFHKTVNVTLGLPIIRTSPDHGSALDIAGKNCANPTSLIEAIHLAATIASNRQRPLHEV